MALKLKDLTETTHTVEMDVAGQAINVLYRPYAFTPKVAEEIAAAEDEHLSHTFCKLVAAITDPKDGKGLVDGKGQEIKLTPDTVKEYLPSRLVREVFDAIAGDQRLGKPSETGSFGA